MLVLLPTLLQLLGMLAFAAIVVVVFTWSAKIPRRLGRMSFAAATMAPPLLALVMAEAGLVSLGLTVTIGLLGAMGLSLAFPLVAFRKSDSSAHDYRERSRTDTVSYLLAGVLWFAIVYWSGSGIDGLYFVVMQPSANVAQSLCTAAPTVICSHLSFWEALHYSAGNVLTLGAGGITPLDEFTRFLGLVQLLQVFVAGYVVARS